MDQKLHACKDELATFQEQWQEEDKAREARHRGEKEQMQTHLAAAEQRAQLAEHQVLKSAEIRNGGESLTLTRNSADSTMVDKRVVAKMLTTYLDCDSHEEVLELMARVLVRKAHPHACLF